MAEKKKASKKPVIGYGANMGAGKKATKKAVNKVVGSVARSAYKSAKVKKGGAYREGVTAGKRWAYETKGKATPAKNTYANNPYAKDATKAKKSETMQLVKKGAGATVTGLGRYSTGVNLGKRVASEKRFRAGANKGIRSANKRMGKKK